MWKIVVGFVLFAALSMYVIITAGDKADMGGEKPVSYTHLRAHET